jgi:hypothetical protein
MHVFVCDGLYRVSSNYMCKQKDLNYMKLFLQNLSERRIQKNLPPVELEQNWQITFENSGNESRGNKRPIGVRSTPDLTRQQQQHTGARVFSLKILYYKKSPSPRSCCATVESTIAFGVAPSTRHMGVAGPTYPVERKKSKQEEREFSVWKGPGPKAAPPPSLHANHVRNSSNHGRPAHYLILIFLKYT